MSKGLKTGGRSKGRPNNRTLKREGDEGADRDKRNRGADDPCIPGCRYLAGEAQRPGGERQANPEHGVDDVDRSLFASACHDAFEHSFSPFSLVVAQWCSPPEGSSRGDTFGSDRVGVATKVLAGGPAIPI